MFCQLKSVAQISIALWADLSFGQQSTAKTWRCDWFHLFKEWSNFKVAILPYFKIALLVAVITVGTKLFNPKKLKTRASLCLSSVEETTSASNQLLTCSPLWFGHPGLPGVSKTMEDNGGKLKKLEKGSAWVSPNVVFFFQPTDADGSDSVHFLRDVLVYHFRVGRWIKFLKWIAHVAGRFSDLKRQQAHVAREQQQVPFETIHVDTTLSCVLCRKGYSSTSWLSQPNSCWNVVGNFVCNNTYWKTTAEILTHDFLVYGRHHWRKSQVIGSLQNGLTTTWGDLQLPSRCEWVWGWFCHPHSQMKISKNRWTWWNCEFLWVWTWQNSKVQANRKIKHAASKFCNGGLRFSNGSIYVQIIYVPKKNHVHFRYEENEQNDGCHRRADVRSLSDNEVTVFQDCIVLEICCAG